MTFEIKQLNIKDNLLEYLELIKQLRNTNVSKEKLIYIIQNLPKNHFIFIAKKNNIIVGSITLLVEQKIIRDGKCVLHIEDVVVDKNYRGMGIASKLLDFSKNFATINNCYKIILDCDKKLEDFYKKTGFEKTNSQMSIYL